MGYYVETISIDSDKLKKEIYKKNHNVTSMALELGYSKNYLHAWLEKEALPTRVAKMLDAMYGIPQERYIKTETEKPAEASIDKDELYDTIYRAVYDAMKKAWLEA